jgi:8-oxo-dGTP pyrophosphatase MutT (NUDIX family)
MGSGTKMTAELAEIRPAATVVLWRKGQGDPEVLMGQRGHTAVFMPSKYVFPGGAVDPADATHPLLPGILSDRCRASLRQSCPPDAPGPDAIGTAALRELSEETGLVAAADFSMRFIFRAITPPGRSRRFDARFFLVPAAHVDGDQSEFSGASDELSHLHWVGLAAARQLDLPFITEVVLSEVAAQLQGADQQGVPFFDNSGSVPAFRRLG